MYRAYNPRLCECRKHQERSWTDPTCHRDQERSWTDRICHRNQERSWANPLRREMSFSDGPITSNSGQYHLNINLSGSYLEREPARKAKALAPRLCEHHRSQLEWPNPSCHEIAFSDGPTFSRSAPYESHKDLSGTWLERESARNVKKRVIEMKAALIEKQIENLQMKIDYLQREIKTSELLAILLNDDLKMNHYESRVYAVDICHLGSHVNREDKRSYVQIWQTSGHMRPEISHGSLETTRPEMDTKDIKKVVRLKAEPEGTEVPLPSQTKLQKKWVEESLQTLRTEGSSVSPQNLQKWFQASITNFKEKGPQASKQNLQQWLQTTKGNLQEKCPQASRNDVKEWLEISLRNIQDEGSDVTTLNVEEWLETSMKSIQDFQEQDLEVYTQAVPIEDEQESPEMSKQNVQKFLKASMKTTQDLQERSFEEITQNMQKDPEQTRPKVPEFARDHLRKGWLNASIENLRRGSEKSRINVQEGLQAVKSRLIKKGPEASKQNLQGWLESCIHNLQEECPEESRKDMKEWLEISKNYLQEEGPETSKLNVQEWLQASMRSIQDLQEGSSEGSTQNVEEDLPEDSKQTQPKSPKFSRSHLRKVATPIENLRRGGSEKSRQNVQKGLQAVQSKLGKKGPEASKENLQQWIEARLQNLQEECPEESRKDLKEWLETAKCYLQEEGPESFKLNVQEGLKASMSVQDIEETGSTQNMQEDVLEDLQQTRSEILKLPSNDLKIWIAYLLRRSGSEEEWLKPPVSVQDLQEMGSEELTQKVHEELPEVSEPIRLEVPELSRVHLKKGWLEASVENLKRSGSEESRRNVKEWLQASMTRLRGGPETVQQNLKGWLETSIKTLPEECPEASRKDVEDWLEVSMAHLQTKGPETSKLNVEEWLHKSMSGIQKPQSLEVSNQYLQVEGGFPIGVRPSLERTNLLKQILESPDENVHEWYTSNLIKESSAAFEQNVGKLLRLPSNIDSCEVVPGSLQDWLSDSETEHIERSTHDTADRQVRPLRDLEIEVPGPSTLFKGGFQVSTPRIRKGASSLRVQQWLESSIRSLEVAGEDTSKLSLQKWLEDSIRTLDEKCPANSKHDVQEWLQASLSKLQKPNISEHSLQEWVEASLKSLKEECPKIPIRDVVECLQESIKDLQEEAARLSVLEWIEASLSQVQVEDPDSSKHNVKEWLESSLSKFSSVSPETSGHYIKKWLTRSLKNLPSSHHNLQEYMTKSIMSLRALPLVPSRSRYDMDGVKRPSSTMRPRNSRGILKHGSSLASIDRSEVSRRSLISEDNEPDLEQEEPPEISYVFIDHEGHPQILKQRGAKVQWLLDQVGANIKMLVSKVCSAFCRYRKPFKILLGVIPIVLIGLAVRHYRLYCSFTRGLRPC